MTTELHDLEITAVALVDNPANPQATIELFKAEEPQPQGGHTVATETVAKSDLDTVVAELDSAKAELAALAEISNDDLAALRGFEIVKSDAEEDVLKGLPEDVRKRLETAEQTIAKMEADNRRSEFIAKAAEFALVAGADELGPALEQIDRVAPEAAQVIERTLKAANARIAEGGLFGEVGASGADGIESEAEKAIAAEVAKGTPRADAIRKVFTDNPELYPAASA